MIKIKYNHQQLVCQISLLMRPKQNKKLRKLPRDEDKERNLAIMVMYTQMLLKAFRKSSKTMDLSTHVTLFYHKTDIY